jgi:Kef-type K+ transport system membrane component KefB
MIQILLLLAILVASYITTHMLMVKIRRWYLVAGGMEYVLLGLALGPRWLGGLTPEMTEGLLPAVTVGVGSLGLLAGLRLDLRRLAQAEEREFVRVGVVMAAVMLVVLGGPTLGLLAWISWADGALALLPLLPPTLLVVACSLVSASTPIRYTADLYQARGWVSRLMIRVAESSEVLAILVFGAVFAIHHPVQMLGPHRITPIEWYLLQVGLGVLFGALFSLFLGGQDTKDKLLVALLGIIIFPSGIAHYLSLSPLLITFFIGLTLANATPYGARLREGLEQIEKPLYVVLCVFTGAMWQPVLRWEVGLLVGAFLALRWAGKWLGAELALGTSEAIPHRAQGVGAGMVGQGGVSVALVLSYLQVYAHVSEVGSEVFRSAEALVYGAPQSPAGMIQPEHDLTAFLATAVLIGILANEVIAVRAARHALIRAAEIEPASGLFPEDIYRRPPASL